MCHTASDEQVITPPHIKQLNGPTDGEPSAKRLQLDQCNSYTQGVTNNEATTNTRQGNNNKETLKIVLSLRPKTLKHEMLYGCHSLCFNVICS
jgi:hypothetical protein